VTGKQNAVLWIGLIIVALNLVSKWSSIRSIIFAGASATGSSGGVSSSDPASGGISTVPGIGAPASGGVTIPFGGMPVTVPLSTAAAQPTTTVLLWQQQRRTNLVMTS
jgi:hypothetical protein